MDPHPTRTPQDSIVDLPIQHKIRDICPYCLFEIKNEREHRFCGSPDFPELFELRYIRPLSHLGFRGEVK